MMFTRSIALIRTAATLVFLPAVCGCGLRATVATLPDHGGQHEDHVAIMREVGRAFAEKYRADKDLARPLVLDTLINSIHARCENLPAGNAKELRDAFVEASAGRLVSWAERRDNQPTVALSCPGRKPATDTVMVSLTGVDPISWTPHSP